MKVCVLFVMFVCVCVCAGKVGRVEEWENGEDGCKGVNVRWESTNVCPDVCPSVPACPACPACQCMCDSEKEFWVNVGRAASVVTLFCVCSTVNWVWNRRKIVWKCMVCVWECMKKVWMFCCVRGLEEEEEEGEGDEWWV